MSRQLLIVGLFCALAIGCSGAPPEPGTDVTGVGTVNLPLTAEANGATYRLTLATFTITGNALSKPLVIKPLPDTPVDTETLPVGSYSIVLSDGWVLQRKGAEMGAIFKPVKASLVTPNPATFTTNQGVAADVLFGFATPGGDVSLRQGQVNVRIGVQDCSVFDGYASAIATFTVDCLGTIDQNSFSVSPDGVLVRNFDKCTQSTLGTAADAAAAAASKLESIDAYLSLQLRSVRLPFAKECIAGRWADWKLSFDQSGVNVCPLWKKTDVIGAPTPEAIDRFIPQLAKLPVKDDGTRPAFLGQLKESYIYSVAFADPQQPPQKGCDTPGACAQLCAGGFPGFVLRTDGQTVLTDPPYWLLDTGYSSSASDPFLKPGYYHPMSYYGPLPGTQFAHRMRAAPCPGCLAETCTYFAGIHVKLPLKMDCLDPANPGTCVGYCAP